MPKVRRFSGNLKIELSYNDRSDQYRARLCPMKRGEACETVYVGNPKSRQTGTRRIPMAVDSPRAYDHAARAAIAFSKERIQAHAGTDRNGNWKVTMPRRQRS